MLRTIAVCIALMVPAQSTVAAAHSWYPEECCSNRDCMPADRVEIDATGAMHVIVGEQRIWVPRGFEIRPSRDALTHICFRWDDYLKLPMPLCVFMPAGI